jgi:hypothetical protein
LKRQGYSIGSRSPDSSLVPFLLDGLSVNVVVKTSFEKSDEATKIVAELCNQYPIYLNVVRFLKTFAAIYVERFPREDKCAIAPGSFFYCVSAAVALDLLSEGPREMYAMSSIKVASGVKIDFLEALKKICHFIGEAKYLQYELFGRLSASTKFENPTIRENFNKLFRALLAHLEVGSLPADFHARIIPSNRGDAVRRLLEISIGAEQEREQILREKKAEEEMQRIEYIKQKERALSQSRFDYNSDDDDNRGDGCDFTSPSGKRYFDYTDYYMSDEFDEDWGD